ncbi:MAG: heme lyase CcmF/NrfE family subunit [Acidobacteria bacterium]|nr:MAG: heme lyase CcmF/NrfE family subunit [Acidobacteriota bacterium]
MQIFGAYALVLAFVLACYAVLAGVVGLSSHRPRMIASAERAYLMIFPAVLAAVICLLGLIFHDTFSVAYVAEHSNRALPLYYKFAVLWSGQEGSLLFWSMLLSGYGFVALLTSGRKHPQLRPTVAVILAAITSFFLLLNNFVASPFTTLPVGTPADGSGLNPLLQYSQMDVHPPILYLGYIGFAIPFAFALAALIKRMPGDRWIRVTRLWTMIAWAFLTVGIVLGGYWAYKVLGWGGYWEWDPVENAAFLPWLTGTAFLHSVMMQEKRGMLKVWNIGLIFLTFFLTIFGDFLVRSGIVSSVHAFAQSAIGNYFVVFLVAIAVVCLYVFFRNRSALGGDNQLESTVSRESGFLFNNFVLLVAALAILWGTIFPVLSEAIQGEKITVGREFFDRINIPLFLFLLFLTGVGPLLAWRRTSLGSLRRNFLNPALCGVATAIVLVLKGLHDPYPLVAFGLCAFVLVTIAMEFGRGARVLVKRGRSWPGAVVHLTSRNTRRYGGYIIHIGIILMAIGITGAAFNQSVEAPMPYQGKIQIGSYQLVSESYTQDDNPNYSTEAEIIQVRQNGRVVDTLYPSRRFYKASNQAQSMVAIRSEPSGDLYLVYAGDDPNTHVPILHAYIRPLIMWIWVGTIVVIFGTLIALLPSRKSDSGTRPEPVRALDRVDQPEPDAEPREVSLAQ